MDTLFRSAARVYRNQVIGVVLSGALDDGAAGAAAIKARGGTVIVEDPAQALVPDMPGNVVRQMEVDYCLPYAEIAGQLLKLVMNKRGQIKVTGSTRCESLTLDTGLEELEPPGFTCPDCGGVLTEVKSGRSVQLLCHVGHRFSLKTFSEAHADALERALWVALRRLNEQQSIQENLAEANRQNSALSKRYRENAIAAQHDKKLLHEILSRL